MDRLLRRIRKALGDGPKRDYPPLPAPAAASPRGALLERFTETLARAGGRLVTTADSQAWLAGNAGEDTGIDKADILIAETGTVVKTFESREASRASLHSRSSVFLASPDLLVPDLPAALSRLEEAHSGGRAYTVLITGPSRTADIEKELVIPAHGPRELVVLMEYGQV